MKEHLSHLEADATGMDTYDYIVNNVATVADDLPDLIEILRRVDHSGQFLSSTARFLIAVDRERFKSLIEPLVEGAIEKDRERRYIGSLLEAIWGKDYAEHASELRASDDNFRRIYKRIYPAGAPVISLEDE